MRPTRILLPPKSALLVRASRPHRRQIFLNLYGAPKLGLSLESLPETNQPWMTPRPGQKPPKGGKRAGGMGWRPYKVSRLIAPRSKTLVSGMMREADSPRRAKQLQSPGSDRESIRSSKRKSLQLAPVPIVRDQMQTQPGQSDCLPFPCSSQPVEPMNWCQQVPRRILQLEHDVTVVGAAATAAILTMIGQHAR